MNKVILMGRLTRDPEIRNMQSGRMVARLGLAVDRIGAKKESGQQTVDFINLIMWEKSAELAQRYLAKGSKILVEGRLSVRPYTDNNGEKRTATEVVVERFEFAGSKQNDGGGAAPMPEDGSFAGDQDEDVPF